MTLYSATKYLTVTKVKFHKGAIFTSEAECDTYRGPPPCIPDENRSKTFCLFYAPSLNGAEACVVSDAMETGQVSTCHVFTAKAGSEE